MAEQREESERKVYSGAQVRQGDIVLRSRRRRIVFIAGLVGLVLLGLIVGFAA